MQKLTTDTIRAINEYVAHGVEQLEQPIEAAPNEMWQALRETGTELWLDTGDIEQASEVWSAEMTALTTNNTLLNKEIQKGIYDDYIREARSVVDDLAPEQQVIEVAFMLNARHGLRLVRRFGGMVCVELHTDLANDLDGILAYGRRFHAIAPDNFIVKVPLTATGILGARRLREERIRVNFTLEFSARQNALVAAVAQPNFVNVFLGRIGAYMLDNGLGDGKLAGERATLASQRVVASITEGRDEPTRQIAASMRGAEQIPALAGVDVMTMPVKVARAARDELEASFCSQREEVYPVAFADGIDEDALRTDALWHVSEELLGLAAAIDRSPPQAGDELAARVREAGFADLFPRLSDDDRRAIAADGKIPKHERWAERIAQGELAIDTLLNLAGLMSFAADQAVLDDRIAGLLR
ncbi:MAG: transaldolase [Chitinivibrionales bacterium]|nr:transaldolase [Chitinivibrionales bacterium]